MQPKQQIGLFSFTMIVVSLVIGMGIFGSVSASAKEAIAPSVYFSAWIIGGIITLFGALTLAEIGSRTPNTGGIYKVFSYAYHPSIAFAFNCIISVSNASAVGGIAIVGCNYLAKLFPQYQFSNLQIVLASSLIVMVFYGVNLLGIKTSSLIQNILMTIKIGMVLLLISCLFFTNDYAPQNILQHTNTTTNNLSWIQSLGICLIAVSFSYSGYQQTINFGNEIKNPTKNIPRAIFFGMAIIIALYLLVTLSYYLVLGFDTIKNEKEIAFTLVNKVFGMAGAKVFTILIFIGALAYVNVMLLSNPTVFYAMGQDGSLPKVFAKKNIKTEVTTLALSAFTAIVIVIIFFAKKFETILNFSIFLDCFGMVANVAAIFIIRKRTQNLDTRGIYTLKWLYPLAPIIFIIAYLFVGISITIADYKTALVGLYVLVGFVLLYFLCKKKALH
ncbi:MAG: amino acid permease [Bacteroidetes bacterium]|nr:amino acid permease [Bacteroidota bacterium]